MKNLIRIFEVKQINGYMDLVFHLSWYFSIGGKCLDFIWSHHFLPIYKWVGVDDVVKHIHFLHLDCVFIFWTHSQPLQHCKKVVFDEFLVSL